MRAFKNEIVKRDRPTAESGERRGTEEDP